MPTSTGRPGGAPRGRFERFLFRFMGPPQLGSHEPRPGAGPVDVLCPQCGQPESLHTVLRTGGRSRSQCPPPVDP